MQHKNTYVQTISKIYQHWLLHRHAFKPTSVLYIHRLVPKGNTLI